MDAFELLKADHEKVSGLFDEIEAATDQSKKNLFAQLKTELDIHAHIEETILYPALENTKEAREITLEAYEEHRVVKDLLAELEAANPDEEWSAKLKVLRENVDQHVEEEEGELFNKAEDALGDEEIERLGNEMAAEKARQQGKPQPATERAAKKAAATTRSDSSKPAKKRGLLGTLANLVGLGDKEESPTTKRTAKSAAKKAGKKAPAKKAAKKQTAKKAAAKRATKTSGNKKAAVRSRSTAQKTTRSASKKSTSKNTTKARTSKSEGTKKRSRKR